MSLRKLLFLVAFSLVSSAIPRVSWACPDIDGLLDINCDQQLIIITFGDSITFGIKDSTGLGYPGRLNQIFPSAIVINLGDPGERTPTGRSRAAQSFAANANADYIIILEGVNDYWLANRSSSSTRNNLVSMKNSGLNTGALTLLANLTQVRRSFQQPWVSAVNSQINSIREIDFFSLGQGIISGDLLHPNNNGYQTMANFLSVLLIQLTPLNRPADNDGDTIYDFAEPLFGTSPTNPDSDGDGLLDGHEVFIHGSSPLLSDSDNDGFTDSFEVNTLGSDPSDPKPSAPTMQGLELLQP